MSDTISHDGRTFVKSDEGYRGKKAQQVANILKQLQENPGIPYDFDELCMNAGAKYPTDVQAAAIALHMCELVDVYKLSSGGKTMYLVWTD